LIVEFKLWAARKIIFPMASTDRNIIKKEIFIMDKYVCNVCGYVYDPEQGDPDNGVEPGTKFEELPDDWECPVCSVPKDDFDV